MQFISLRYPRTSGDRAVNAYVSLRHLSFAIVLFASIAFTMQGCRDAGTAGSGADSGTTNSQEKKVATSTPAGNEKTAKAANNPLTTPATNSTDPNVGKFEGDGLTVTFATDGSGYRGTITLNGQTYPATASADGKKLTGSFVVGSDSFDFTAAVIGDTLALSSGGTSYRTTRVAAQPANPLDKALQNLPNKGPLTKADPPTRSQTGATTEPATDPPSKGKTKAPLPFGFDPGDPPKTKTEDNTNGNSKATARVADPLPAAKVPMEKMTAYKHPMGFTFQHPVSWKPQASQGGVLLIPGDHKKDKQGQPLELFVVGGQPAPGITNAGDPRVVQFFDAELATTFPHLKRTGQTSSLRTLIGQGAVMIYEGKSPTTNADVRATLYVALHQGTGVFLLHAGTVKEHGERATTARAIFSSFGWTKGQIDKALVGLWHRNEFSRSETIGVATAGSSTNRYYQFNADGTVAYSANSRVFGGTADGGVTIDDPGGQANVSRGKYFVSGKRLTIQWNQGGVEEYDYSVFAHTEGRTGLALLPSGEKKKIYYIKQ